MRGSATGDDLNDFELVIGVEEDVRESGGREGLEVEFDDDGGWVEALRNEELVEGDGQGDGDLPAIGRD